MHRGKRIAIQLGWLTVIGAVATESRADNEFVAISAEDYGAAGRCAGDPLSNANEDGLYMDNGFTAYDQREYQTNALYDARDIADQNNFAWGADESDPYGSDFADVVFLSGHSGSSCTTGSERVWVTPGDSSDPTCAPYLAHKTSASRHARLGGVTAGRDADALVTYGCQTTQYCVYTSGAFKGLSATDGQLNMLNGFHGDVAEIAGYQADLGSYSSAAVNNDLGEAWLDYMYGTWSGGAYENCPSAIGWGANTTETDDFYSNAGWLDFHDTGARTITRYYALCGCDPYNATALPAC
jgi:hypothetical protein